MWKNSVLLLCVTACALALPLQEQPKSRIIGGTTARAGQFPFAVGIRYRTTTGLYFCTGTLISNTWVLTAGLCVNGATQFTISLGSTHFDNPADPNQVILATSEYAIHPDFDENTYENNIGLIEFRIAVQLSDYIQPITELASEGLNQGEIVVSLGWGQTSDSDDNFSDTLKWVYVTSLSNNECSIFYPTIISENFICVDGNYNEGTCFGDLGSPLVQYGEARGHNIHVGISSFLSPNGCESLDPSGFTRTAPYRNYIRDITGI